jgi:outer membrane protein assembly factor BamB
MRRSLPIACALSTVSALALVAGFASCGGEEDGPPQLKSGDAALDALLVGDNVAPPVPDADPPPGDVCGNRGGLEPSNPWPLRGGCPTRAGWSALSGPQQATVSWTVPLPAAESSPALAANGLVWVGTTSGDVVAIGNGGDVRWAHRTGAAVRSSPAINANGNVIVAGGDGILYALAPMPAEPQDAGPDADAASPPPRIVFQLAIGPMSSSPVIGADGTIYIGTTQGKCVAVLGDGSATKWSATTNDTLGSSPALGQDGTIYVGSSDRSLYALTTDGNKKWALDLGAEVHGSPAVGGDGTIYVGTQDGKLHAIDSAGKERWSYAAGGPITGTPAVYAGAVYVGSEDKKLHAVSTIDGKARWTYDTLGAVGTPLIASDGTVFVGAADARLYAITSKGSLFFAVNVKGKVTGAPAVGTGPALYITTDNGIVAIGP